MNPFHDRPMPLPCLIEIRDIILLSNVSVIFYDPVVYNWYYSVIVKDRGIIYVLYPDLPVIIDVV